MSGPLSHLTVVEVAGIGPAPFACMLLRDMGARVIRVDRPPVRSRGGIEDLMRNDGVVDRGRESLSLNMKDPRAVDIALRWIEQADILVEGFRPGVAERLGVGPAVCQARNPRLVYGRMTGWGQTGPLASSAGHDINYVALTGALHAIGPSEQPMPPLNLVGDYGGGGMLLALGVLAAQAQAQRTGIGQVVDAAMTDGAALLMTVQYGLLARGAWRDQRGRNFLDGGAHFYGTYACKDGHHVSVGAIEPMFYQQLLSLCGIEDPQFEKQWDEQAWPALKEKLAAVFRQKSRAEWCALLEGSDACFAPVLSMTEAPEHPHNRARGTFISVEGVTQPAPAPRFDRSPSETPKSAPSVGQDTRALLAELGCTSTDVEHLLQERVVFDQESM